MDDAAPRDNVVLVRHGETSWSKAGRHTGRTDLPLTPDGRAQAAAVGPLLAGRPFARVLASPLGRARETARLAGFDDDVEVDDDLVEWDYGEAEGRTTAEMRVDDPGWTVWRGPVRGGETAEEVGARVDRVIERVLSADGDSLLFGHGHCLRILAARWCELDPREGKRLVLHTATISELGWEHDYRTIQVWNQPSA